MSYNSENRTFIFCPDCSQMHAEPARWKNVSPEDADSIDEGQADLCFRCGRKPKNVRVYMEDISPIPGGKNTIPQAAMALD